MDNEQFTLLPETLKKHSALVAMACDISLVQRKAFNGLLTIAAGQLANDPSAERFEIDLSALANLTGLDTKNKKRLLSEINKLMSTKATWNVLEKDPEDSYTEGTVLLADFTLKKKSFIFGFSPLVRQKILKPRMYAPLNLASIRAIERKHTMPIYEICKDYRKLHRVSIPIIDLYSLLGLRSDEYNRHALFDSKVVAPAVEEINSEKTELTVRYRYVKTGKNITDIVFNITEDTEKQVRQGESTQTKELRELTKLLPEELRGNKKILSAIKTKYIQEGYDFVESNIKFAVKKAKTNPGKMVVMALEDDFAHDDRAKSVIKKEKTKAKSTIEPKNIDTAISTDIDAKERTKYFKYFKGLSDDEQEIILQGIYSHKERGGKPLLFGPNTSENIIYIFLKDIKGIKL